MSDTMTERERSAVKQLAALTAALQELELVPNLPGIPYAVAEPTAWGEPPSVRRLEIPGSQVEGIFAAIESHAKTLAPLGERALRAMDDVDRVRRTLSLMIGALHDMRDALRPLVSSAHRRLAGSPDLLDHQVVHLDGLDGAVVRVGDLKKIIKAYEDCNPLAVANQRIDTNQRIDVR